MPDEVKKTYVSSIIASLKKDVDSHILAPDAQESVEVAIQCLQAAYDVGEEEEARQQATLDAAPNAEGPSTATAGVGNKEIDLFDMFQQLYIERNPKSIQMAEQIKNEGNRLMKDGKYNEALMQYNRAITFDPKNPIFYCNRAAAYIRLGDNDRAITDCKSALSYNPNYGKAYGRLGIAYSNLGKYDEAQQAYTKAIELEPDNQDYRNNLEVARNARNQAPLNAIPQLTEGINAMLTNPAIRTLFNSADIDLEQLQNMSQNPMIMNIIGQMFNPQGGGAGGAAPPLPNDMMQLFQSFASQLAASVPNPQNPNSGGGTGTGGNNQSDGNQQPPPSS